MVTESFFYFQGFLHFLDLAIANQKLLPFDVNLKKKTKTNEKDHWLKKMQRKRRKKVKRTQRHLPLEIITNNLTEKKTEKKPGASAFHFCMSEINRYFGYRRVNYLVHRIQPPIRKLQILNFHYFLFQTNQIVFVNPDWHDQKPNYFYKQSSSSSFYLPT